MRPDDPRKMRTDLRAVTALVLKEAGLEGQGILWRIPGPEVEWLVRIDTPPQSFGLGIEIGLELQQEHTALRPADCGIFLHFENHPAASGFDVATVLDPASPLSMDDRRARLTGALGALIVYMREHLTADAVRDAYRAGDLSAAVIHEDARAVLTR